MNNNIFQFDRFGKLIVRNLQRSPKSWTLTLVVLAGLPLLFFLINVSGIDLHVGLTGRMIFLNLALVLAFILSPNILFYNYNHPKKGLSEVMLPASALEKYIVMQLACIIFAPLTVIVLFGGMDSLLAFIFPKIYEGYAIEQVWYGFVNGKNLIQLFITLQAVLFCNLLFVRRKILKTAGALILALIFILLVMSISITFFEEFTSLTDISENFNFNFEDRSIFEIYRDDHPLVIFIQIIGILADIVLPILLIIGSYRLLKTKRY